MTARRILIVESGWQRGVLAATRSLGETGHYVAIASPVRGHAARSRHAARWFRVPEVGSTGLVPRVGEIARGGRFDIVFAGDDEHLLHLSQHRAAVAPAIFPYPAHEAVCRSLDKVSLYDEAREAGLRVPETTLEAPDPPAAGWIAKERVYQPGSSHQPLAGEAIERRSGRNLVFQRLVAGRLVALVTLTARSGRLVYAAAQRADAVYPEPFGVSVRARTVHADPDAVAGVGRLLRGLGWWGLAELQFIVTDSGEHHLIDFNGRFFGSLALSRAAGANLPAAWVALALGGSPALAPPRYGARYQWLEGDLRRAAASGNGRTETGRALRFAAGATHSVWERSDPLPALRLAGDLLGRAARKARTR